MAEYEAPLGPGVEGIASVRSSEKSPETGSKEGSVMKVKDLVDEAMQGEQEHVVFVRAPDGTLGMLETET